MKRLLALAALSLAAAPGFVHASPITLSYNFTFDQDAVRPGETPVTGNVTFTVNSLPASSGYTSNGSVDLLSFSVSGLSGLVPADTNYLKMLFDSGGHLTYLLVSDRSDFALSALPPRSAGYVLGLKANDLITGTGITVGSDFGSYFSYYINGRNNVDFAYTFTTTNVAKVTPPVASVPDSLGTFSTLGLTLVGLVSLRRRILA